MKIRVRDCISSINTDIDLDAKWDARDADAAVNRCVAAATESLKCETTRLDASRRVHLHQILISMKHAHRAVRELLRHEGREPLAVNVMPLVRTQVETLYSLCLIIEQPTALDFYLKDGWKKLFVRHIAMREECLTLPRVVEGLAIQKEWIDKMQG